MTPEAAVEAALEGLERRIAPGPVVVAASGGGDSTALLHVAARANLRGRALLALTVDHGLRPDSAEEAAGVAGACVALGVAHEVLRWDGGGRGNLQARAREARRRLIGARARDLGSPVVLLGHTADDQAETVLLRLARGSGVDGLAGMPASFGAEGAAWERPFLSLARAALRAWLMERGIAWVEDPSNEDPRFDRARARAMMAALADLGLTRERLVRTAGHMRAARAVLRAAAAARAGREVKAEGDDLLLPASLVREAGSRTLDGRDGAARVLAAALMWVGGRERRPRHEALLRLALLTGGGRAATLAGCRVVPDGEAGGEVRVVREGPRRHASGPGRPPEAVRASRPASLTFEQFVLAQG